LLARFRAVRAQVEAVCAPLSSEDMQVQSMPDASPTKWHLAHTTWFYETFVLADPAMDGYRPFRPEFAYLFNSYYESLGPRQPRGRRGLLTRPARAEVSQYRAQVDAAMADRLPRHTEEDFLRLRPMIELGINHEQQHLELILTDIKHAFAENPLRPVYRKLPPMVPGRIAAASWREFDAGVRCIGYDGPGFAFDNEEPAHRVFVEAFAIAGRLVTCGEYLAFMADRGYQRPEWWLSDGWNACQEGKWTAPLYWV